MNQTLMLREVQRGLARPDQRLPSKYFYDARGSELFEKICELPEYYLTRTEVAILRAEGGDIGEALGPRVRLVEFGSGSSLKTRLLLRHLPDPACYVPIDISADALADAVAGLRREFPRLLVQPHAADYSQELALPSPPLGTSRTVCYFPGSTLGNFEHGEALRFLSRAARLAGRGGGMVIGADLRKDPSILLPAYNDSAGVTAAFNRNMLRHVNEQLGADFDPAAFTHRAIWNDAESRIEMQLVPDADQTVTVGNGTFVIRAGEPLTTEFSHKWSEAALAEMFSVAGFRVERVWVDPSGWFGVFLLRVDS